MTARAFHLALATSAAACGLHDAVVPDANLPRVDAVFPEMFTLTSSMLVDGGRFLVANTCEGVNMSPDLMWTGAPPGTESYAVVLTDETYEIVQWVIFDIPASEMSLPPAIEKWFSPPDVRGAHQTESFIVTKRGYLGPCPPPGQGAHSYVFTVYALDTPILRRASNSTTRLQAQQLINERALASASLRGVFSR
jgi:Raf kinase inhibitor-like YbhB/YbcL family protein